MTADDQDDLYDEWSFEDADPDCTWCGGDGYAGRDDPIQCCRPHSRDGLCACSACGGTGLAKYQTIW